MFEEGDGIHSVPVDIKFRPEASSSFITKDSGEREVFESGAQRDTQTGKPRYDLIPLAPLKRLADLYSRGAEKYDEHNWKKGISSSRCYASLFRHLIQWAEGDREEDHLAAVAWGTFALMWNEEKGLEDMERIRA